MCTYSNCFFSGCIPLGPCGGLSSPCEPYGPYGPFRHNWCAAPSGPCVPHAVGPYFCAPYLMCVKAHDGRACYWQTSIRSAFWPMPKYSQRIGRGGIIKFIPAPREEDGHPT